MIIVDTAATDYDRRYCQNDMASVIKRVFSKYVKRRFDYVHDLVIMY